MEDNGKIKVCILEPKLFPQVYKIDIELEVSHFNENKIDYCCKQNLFRIIQEQLTNITKHANASSVRILADNRESSIRLVITDNGCGFDVCSRKKGIGFINILHRAESFNGKAEIISSKGKGCELYVTIPACNYTT